MLSQDVIARLTWSTHARERWEERVKTPVPSIREIERLIAESRRVQKYSVSFSPRGIRKIFPAVYCHKGAGVAIKVDWDKKRPKVVTVIDL